MKKPGKLRASIKDVGDGLGVKNKSDLVLKEIQDHYGEKNLTRDEIKCFKMTEREIFKNFVKISEDRLNTKSIKNVFVKNTIMIHIIHHCRGEKKSGIKKIDGFRQKLMIPDYKMSESIKHKVKSKTGTIFVNEDILEEYSVAIYEIDLYFSENYEKRIQVDKNGQ